MGNTYSTTYEIAGANEYIVKTGLGIKDVKVSKSCMKWPMQNANKITVTPDNYEFSLHAMSSEKLQFVMPGSFTIGVDLNDENKLALFIKLIATTEARNRNEIILGIIEGEVRVHCAQLTLEQIFKDRVMFKQVLVDAIQKELDQFGLKIFNANIKELEDAPGSEYFSYMRQKTRSLAESEAKINIADAQNRGTVGSAEKEANTRVVTATIQARTTIAENEQKQQMLQSNTTLRLVNIEQETRLKLSQVQQDQEVSKRNLDLEREVELVRQKKRLEELRATKGTDATIAAEVVQKETDARVYQQVKEADANLYKQQKEAEGILILADAQKKALEEYKKVFTEQNALLSYIMVEKGMYTEMAKINSEAIKGLNPNISVWNTGSAGADGNSDPYASMRNIFQALPPILTTVQQQTGIIPPAYLGQVPQQKKEIAK